jgi:hypothetical protein
MLEPGSDYTTEYNVNLKVFRGRETGWTFQSPTGQQAIVTSADNLANNGIVHGIDTVLTPPPRQPQGTQCTAKDQANSMCAIPERRAVQQVDQPGPPGG